MTKEEKKAYNKAYRESHKEEIKASDKEYYEAHIEERKAYNKAYRESHIEEIKAYNKAYRESHIEEKAILSLKRIAKKWPESLWLFSAASTLWVMRKGEDGLPEMDGEGYDHNACIDSINIENDGGDW